MPYKIEHHHIRLIYILLPRQNAGSILLIPVRLTARSALDIYIAKGLFGLFNKTLVFKIQL